MRERYFRWDEGRSHAFYVYESALPIFKRFAEDYVVEPDGAETLFTWTVAIEPKNAFRLPLKVLAPHSRRALGRYPARPEVFRQTRMSYRSLGSVPGAASGIDEPERLFGSDHNQTGL